MKTIYINGRFLIQDITGEQRYALEIVKQWDKINDENINVVLLCPITKKEIKQSFKNIKIIQIGPFDGQMWLHHTLPKYVKRNKGVLITLCGLSPIFRPDFWTIHDITFIREPKAFNWKFRLLYRFVYKINIKKAKQIFTVSDFSKKEISNYYHINEDNIIVEYSAVSDDLLNKNNEEVHFFDDNKPLYISVGSVKPNKNISYIFKLAKINPDINFLIIGGKNKVFNDTNYESATNIKFTGYISDEKLNYLYKNCSGFIIPSTYEGFGLTPLEAILNGCKRIFMSNIDVFKEIYDRGVNYFDPKSDGFIIDSNATEISDDDILYYKSKYNFYEIAKDYLSIILSKINKE